MVLDRPKEKKGSTGKALAFVFVGGLTLIYCVAELIAALYLGSLTLLSDGFHNLSDVVSLYIAFWAQAVCYIHSTFLIHTSLIMYTYYLYNIITYHLLMITSRQHSVI